jgi:glycolate oxidase
MGVTKKGTDIQVAQKDIKALLDKYRELSKLKVDYNLFGHFGDAHLHFNFMPTPDQNEYCIKTLDDLYKVIKAWEGSPFAEHGIGLLKKKFISDFYSDNQRKVFKKLKDDFDPYGQFFIEGFMSC